MNIEQLRNAWIEAGQKVSDIQNQIQTALVDDSITVDVINDLKNKLETAKAKRDLAKQQLDEAEANAKNLEPASEPKISRQEVPENMVKQFAKDFKDLMTGKFQPQNAIGSDLDADGNGAGLTIPQDIQTNINALKRQYNSLEQYVEVIPVSTLSGSRVLEKWTDVTPFANIDDEFGTIGNNDDPNFKLIKYLIKRYAGISTLSNTLLKDTAEQLVAYIEQWLAKKQVVTRNNAILAELAKLPNNQKKTIKDIDGIKDIFNTQLDPALHATTKFYTNQSGFNVLDKVKDSNGRYLLQPMVVADSFAPMSTTGQTLKQVPSLLGKELVVISDRWLPNGGTASTPTYPLYIGDMAETVKLFDRERLSLMSTNVGAGAFETDTTKIRAIDRFDVQLWDTEAMVVASFAGIADQSGSTSGTTAS